MAGLPVGLGDSGGTWAMGGLSGCVPVKPVQAAQSPLNIMWGNYTPLTGQPRSQPAASESGSQRIIYIMSCAPAGQHRWVWRTRLRLLLSAPEPVLGKNRCSSLAAMPSSGKQRCRQVGLRPPFLPPPPQPRCTGCARLAVASSLLVPVLAISAPCSPHRGLPLNKVQSCKIVLNQQHRCSRASQGAAGRLCAARTRRTAARRPDKLASVQPLPKILKVHLGVLGSRQLTEQVKTEL
ncbi:hypothetical protein [Xenorhabdus bovienii]|uniref:hypothetical protein n=1 Tax=Xenorhabdus bovienii TaxID=40576 RepID=UPI0023B31021|nr:hypothetical protein [Xenorhabdus bovienii]